MSDRNRRCSTWALALMLGWASLGSDKAQACSQEQITAAINTAGEKLRQMTAQTQPVLQAKLLKLKEIKGWSDAEYEEKGYGLLEDQRTARLDATANELLGRLDQMSADTATRAADCARLSEVDAASLELQATIKAKSQYILARADQLIGEPKPAAAVAAAGTPPAAPRAEPKAEPKWSTSTKSVPPSAPPAAPPVVAVVPPSDPSPPPTGNVPASDGEGFTIDEIVAASHGVFGKVSANLARVLEHAFSKSGKPRGYILGSETGGAFIAGLRYGSGTLYMRDGRSMPIYWHGPSLGADVGAQGAATLFLVYKAEQPEDVLATFTGLEGSAFVVGGVGMTFMSNKRVDMAPIRSGIGLRLGANIGYMRFTARPTWNPF